MGLVQGVPLQTAHAVPDDISTLNTRGTVNTHMLQYMSLAMTANRADQWNVVLDQPGLPSGAGRANRSVWLYQGRWSC